MSWTTRKPSWLWSRSPSERPARARLVGTALALVLSACAGGLLWQPFGSRNPLHPFPHEVHVALKDKLDCESCHDLEEDGIPFPPKPLCVSCHKKKEEGEAPTPLEAALASVQRIEWTQHSGYFDLIFDHESHAEYSEATCDDCHPKSSRTRVITAHQAAAKPLCMDCHERKHATTRCESCHKEIRRNLAPPDHDEIGFLARHGRGLDLALPGDREAICLLCHEDDSCTSCHATMLPQDHGTFFRLRGHGFQAEMDRDRCLVCHEDDSCSRCHASTLPQNHRASFGSPANRHCLGCHEPFQDMGCRVCHTGAPSHALALPVPPPPHPGPESDCSSCHFVIPHPDNGDPCTICHR